MRNNPVAHLVGALLLSCALVGCTATDAQTDAGEQAPVETEQKATINQEEAFAIALQNAGLAESEVTFDGAELATKDTKLVYTVTFNTNTMDYAYDVDATTSEILSSDIKYRD